VPYATNQAQGRPTVGSSAYAAPNPDFGATFTYYLKDAPQSPSDLREATERELSERGADVPFPGYDELRAEAGEGGARVLLQVSDATGEPVRWVEAPAQAGLHRVTWDLRRPAPNAINLSTPGFTPPWVTDPVGPLAPPGEYSVQMVLVSPDGVEEIGSPQSFDVKPAPGAPPGTDFVAVAEFQQETSELSRRVRVADGEIGRVRERLRYMRAALMRTPRADAALLGRMDELGRALDGLSLRLQGDPIRGSLNVSSLPSISGRIGNVIGGHWSTRQNPTLTQRGNIQLAGGQFETLERELADVVDAQLMQLEEALAAAGAPWTPGGRVAGR
jgi:hypothetical protein